MIYVLRICVETIKFKQFFIIWKDLNYINNDYWQKNHLKIFFMVTSEIVAFGNLIVMLYNICLYVIQQFTLQLLQLIRNIFFNGLISLINWKIFSGNWVVHFCCTTCSFLLFWQADWSCHNIIIINNWNKPKYKKMY